MKENSDEYQQETQTEASPTETLLKGWTKKEKLALWTSLKQYNSNMIEVIAENIPTKTKEEVKSAIDHYKKRAIATRATVLPKCVSKQRKVPQRNSPQIPLGQWAKQLTDTIPYKDLQTETADAIRLIANFEKFPPSKNTEQIDFRKVYHQIADAIEGKSLPDDKLTTEVLNTCLIPSVLLSKAFIKPKAFQFLINSFNSRKNDNMSGFYHTTPNDELSPLRQLSLQRNFNPLNVPEEYLTPSTHLIHDGTV